MRTDITMVLDRSGSMASVKSDVIGGINKFLEDQKKVEGECRFTLVQFDTQNPFEAVYRGEDIRTVKPLDGETYQPRAGTPLHDAIGDTINDTGRRLSELPEDYRPEKVIFVIQTDGLENSSTKFTAQEINNMIKHQTNTYNWEFIFLGANQDAISTGEKLGISRNKSLTYASNTAGTSSMYDSLSRQIGAVRCCASAEAAFDDEDRKKQKDAGAFTSK